MRIAQSVRALTPYTPGEQPKDRSVIKLNTNENPYLPSPLVEKTLASFDLDRLRRYPDPVFTELREKIAERDGTVPARVFVGNGSDEVLTLAARAFVDDDEAIGSFDPSYSLYKTLAAIRNVPFAPSPLAPDFTWAPPVTRAGDAPVALFLLTNPNAPTSVRYPREQVAAFAKRKFVCEGGTSQPRRRSSLAVMSRVFCTLAALRRIHGRSASAARATACARASTL